MDISEDLRADAHALSCVSLADKKPYFFASLGNEKCNSVEDTSVYYHDSDSWPTHEPMGLWFNNTLLCNFIEEWANHKKELLRGEITKEQYFEWKITWPYSCHK